MRGQAWNALGRRGSRTAGAGHLEQALGHAGAAAVHEAVQTEAVVGVGALLEHVERPLRCRVQPHVPACVVQRQGPLAVAAVQRHQLAERYQRCSQNRQCFNSLVTQPDAPQQKAVSRNGADSSTPTVTQGTLKAPSTITRRYRLISMLAV